jgi:hypothetical protein
MQSIMKQVPADFLKAPGSKEAGLKWCLTIAKNGLQLATSNLTQVRRCIYPFIVSSVTIPDDLYL